MLRQKFGRKGESGEGAAAPQLHQTWSAIHANQECSLTEIQTPGKSGEIPNHGWAYRDGKELGFQHIPTYLQSNRHTNNRNLRLD